MSGARRRFRFIKEIAEGGFGKVYLAEQLSADGFSRIVAVKLLHAKWSSHDEVVMRTRDEARLLGLIRHQHIVRVEDLTSIDGKCAIVMEYLEGVDLKGVLTYCKSKTIDFPRAALFEIMIAVAAALDAAYNGRPLQGGDPLHVIHRDIKPSNVFVTVSSAIKVLDFGTARANFAEREAKTQALAFGSQGYMAPERMLGEEDTPAADVFSLGITLYELLTLENFGRIPPRPNKFAAKVEDRIGSIQLEGDPEWADQIRETLKLMMAYEPADRPTAKQLVDIFELLAQNAEDMGFRRFCRTMVAEAKAAEPDLDTGDPLTGNIISEDVSSTWSVGPSGAPKLDVSGPQETDPGSAVSEKAAPTMVPMGFDAAQSVQVADEPAAEANSGPTDVSTGAYDPYEDEAPPKKGGIGKIILILVVLIVLLGLGLVVLVAGGGGAYVFFGSSGGSTTIDVNKPPDTTEVVPETPKITLPDGLKVVNESKTTSGKSRKTVLRVNPSDGALIKIRGVGGYEAEWDGKSEVNLGALPEGSYRANITKMDGSKIRNKSFRVVKRKNCDFTFDIGKESWEGECK